MNKSTVFHIKTISDGTISSLLREYIGQNSKSCSIIDKFRNIWLDEVEDSCQDSWQKSWNKFIDSKEFKNLVAKYK